MVERTKGWATGGLPLLWAGALLFAALGAGEAQAQEVHAESSGAWAVDSTAHAVAQADGRDFFVSGALGFGSLGFPEDEVSRENGLSGDLSVTTSVTPQLRAGIGLTGWTKDLEGVRMTFGTLTATARFYPQEEGVFLNGGLGLGRFSVSYEDGIDGSETGLGLVLGGGYDYALNSDWAVSPNANAVIHRINSETVDIFQFGLGVSYRN